MPINPRTAAGIAGGIAIGIGSDVLVVRWFPRHRVPLMAAGLAGAAAIYPLARSRRPLDAHVVREVAALAGFSAAAYATTRRNEPAGRRLLAAGWAIHAAFDAVHDSGADSLIPDWYPAACAACDVAVAARLVAA